MTDHWSSAAVGAAMLRALACWPIPVRDSSLTVYLSVLPSALAWYVLHPAGSLPASAARAGLLADATRVSVTALPLTLKLTTAACDPDRPDGSNPWTATPAQDCGVTAPLAARPAA